MGTLREAQCAFLITSRSVLLRIKNFSDESCRENRNTHFMFKIPLYVNRAVYDIIWGKKVCRAWRVIGDNMAHAHLMLYT